MNSTWEKTLIACGFAMLMMAGCNSNDNNTVNSGGGGTSPDQQAQGSLFQKYGGTPGMQKFVADVGTALIADCTQNPYFTTTLGTPGHDTLDRLKSCLVLQFSDVFGGPATYPGPATSLADPTVTYSCEDMNTIHADLGIPSSVFSQFIVDVAATLKADGVSDEDIAQVAPVLIGLQGDIVAPPGTEMIYNYTPTNPANNGCSVN